MPPKDLPGFYYDAEKNRYFPLKGPIPGSKRPSSSSTSSSSAKRIAHGESSGKDQLMGQRKVLKSSNLLQVRELHGRSIISNKCRCSFKKEYQKLKASHPMVWKYNNTIDVADSALEQLYGITQTPKGLELNNFLLTGSMNGHISLYDVATAGRYSNYMSECMPKSIWPLRKSKAWQDSAVASIWCLTDPQIFSSRISCIKRFSWNNRALVTTFGSGAAGGSVCILNLHEPLDILQTPTRLSSRISQIKSFNRTIWTADCNPHGTHAVIGTNRGAALLNLETKAVSGFYHIRSDVLSEQFIHSGNVVLCGLRNGAVVSIDTRQKQSRLPEHSARPPSRPNTLRVINGRPAQHEESSTIQKKLNSCNSVVMSSAVCSLVAFQSDERYFLASSMDGSIKLFDHRLLQGGAVQFYAGQVNSHTRLQLGVDPSETFVMSGGEDCFLRIWSIKNGELIFGERISDSILATICWPRNRNNLYDEQKPLAQAVDSYLTSHSWGAWLGSPDGLFYMHGT